MGYFVKKSSFGLKPVTFSTNTEINVYDTDGYYLSPDEYVNIQQTLSRQKEKIVQLQQEKEQEEQKLLDYYQNAFQRVKKSTAISCLGNYSTYGRKIFSHQKNMKNSCLL